MSQKQKKPVAKPTPSENVQRLNKENYNKNIHPRVLASLLDNYLSQYQFAKRLTKRQRVIAWLIVSSSSEARVTRFDAEIIGDHCLNTTISEIGRIDGIEVSRADTKRPTRFGKDTDCKEYWFDKFNLMKAKNYIVSLTLKEVA